MEMNTNTTVRAQDRKQRSGIARFFIGLFKLVFLLAAIAAGGLLGYFGWQQFTFNQTVNEVQNTRISRIDSEMIRQNEVEALIREAADELKTEISDLSSQLTRLTVANEALEGTVDAQGEEIAALNGALGDVSGRIDSIDTSIDNYGSALLALQQDISASGVDVDSIGATVDSLVNDFESLSEEIESLQESLVISPTVELEGDSPSAATIAPAAGVTSQLAVWRLWGLVVRTKLHLAEADLEAAASSLSSAQEAVAGLVETGSEDLAADLSEVDEKLATAQESIATKPAAANRTLDEVLDTLEGLLSP